MTIRNFIYYVPIIISAMGIVSIKFTLKFKDKKNIKYINTTNVICIIYLLVFSLLIHNLFSIIVGFQLLIVWFISFLGVILYIISIFICLLTRSKQNSNTDNKKLLRFTLTIILMPIILFVITLCREIYLINHSTILLSGYSAGNGGFGDSNEFIYVISDNYFKEISLDIRYSNFFIHNNAKKIDEKRLKSLGYNIVLDNNIILVYKNNELIHKKRINIKYFNIELEEIYYNEKS